MASSSKNAKPAISTDWDIDQYRSGYESEEHWQLKRRFMEVHKSRYPEERLVCYAQCFFNMEFMGCKYPQETMRIVNELADEVAKEFRESRSNRLKRTFVAGSEAAEQRFKGRKNADQPQQKQQQQHQQQHAYQQNQQFQQFQQRGQYQQQRQQQQYQQQPNQQFKQRGQHQQYQQNQFQQNPFLQNQQFQQYPSFQQRGQAQPYLPHQPYDLYQQYHQRGQQQQNQYQQRGQQRSDQYSDGPSTSKNSQSNYSQRPQFQSNEHNDINTQKDNSSQTKQKDIFSGLKYGNFVVLLTGGRKCLSLSAKRCSVPYEERKGSDKGFEIYLNNKKIAEANELSLKASKAIAFQKALNLLQSECYTIKHNPLQDTIKINKKDNKIVCDVTKEPIDDLAGQKLDSSNKGFKMMKMMGWSGGGLGANKQGREEPVSYLLKNNRSGLGNLAHPSKKYFLEMLQNYVKSEDLRPLHFEPTFTKNERALLHETAARLNLKSVARGVGEKRFLTINKKDISEKQILTEVLINKNPRYLNKYIVQVPKCKEKLYPEHNQQLEL